MLNLAIVCRDVVNVVTLIERSSQALESVGAPSDLRERARMASLRTQNSCSKLLSICDLSLNQITISSEPLSADLWGFALYNAVECCVQLPWTLCETMAERLTEPTVPEELETVLRDLMRAVELHLDLAWDIQDWCLGQLSPQRGRHLRATQQAKAQQLASREQKQQINRYGSPLILERALGRGAAA